MLAFVVPVAHPLHFRRFAHALRLLDGTVASILGQTHPGFRVYVVGSSHLRGCFDDHRLTTIETDVPSRQR